MFYVPFEDTTMVSIQIFQHKTTEQLRKRIYSEMGTAYMSKSGAIQSPEGTPKIS